MSAARDAHEALMRKKRETEKPMVNKTPLRVVPIGEPLPADDDNSGTPTVMMPEHDAITRRMPEPPAGMPGQWRRFLNWKLLLLAGGLLLAAALVVVSLAARGKGGGATTTSSPPAGVAASPAPAVQPAGQAGPPPAQNKATPETIRLEIKAEPIEAVLSLDGNAVAGHRLSIEVPRDRGIHVISATAPGYVPFNQHVSFGSDVVLNISLQRGRMRPAYPTARTRPVQAEPRAKNASARAPAGRPGAALEPGMSLEGPSARPNAKPIDERNPYKP